MTRSPRCVGLLGRECSEGSGLRKEPGRVQTRLLTVYFWVLSAQRLTDWSLALKLSLPQTTSTTSGSDWSQGLCLIGHCGARRQLLFFPQGGRKEGGFRLWVPSLALLLSSLRGPGRSGGQLPETKAFHSQRREWVLGRERLGKGQRCDLPHGRGLLFHVRNPLFPLRTNPEEMDESF